jgi:hypothetical protein
MSGKDKNIKTTFSDFMRYMGKKMSNEERNVFERELQKDPFAEEAFEGFSGTAPDEIKEDLATLQKKLKSRTARKQKSIYYRIAASVAVLMVISSVFIIIQRHKPEKLISENVRTETQLEISKSPILSEPMVKDDKKITLNEFHGATQRTSQKPLSTEKNEISDVKIIEKRKQISAASQSDEILSIPEKREAEMRAITVNQAGAVAKSGYIMEAPASPVLIKGKIISSEDNLPIPGASIVVKGSALGTQTDSGGNFILSLPDTANHSLVANFIGMESKEFSATKDSVVNIRLNPSILAINEVVVIGYGSVKKAEKDMIGGVSFNRAEDVNEVAGYSPPQPVNGKDNFDKYIEENIRRPVDAKPGQKEVVVVSFTVKSSGVKDNIRIIRSPGKSFSDEALRLLNNGPEWKPAEENNRKIDDEVRIQIVFK